MRDLDLCSAADVSVQHDHACKQEVQLWSGGQRVQTGSDKTAGSGSWSL